MSVATSDTVVSTVGNKAGSSGRGDDKLYGRIVISHST